MRKRKNRYNQIRMIVRKVSGAATIIFAILIYGKAGASDMGAPIEEIFPSTFIYLALAVISFYIWDMTGGNETLYNNKVNRSRK